MRPTLATKFVFISVGIAVLGLIDGLMAFVFTQSVADSLHTVVENRARSARTPAPSRRPLGRSAVAVGSAYRATDVPTIKKCLATGRFLSTPSASASALSPQGIRSSLKLGRCLIMQRSERALDGSLTWKRAHGKLSHREVRLQEAS